MFSCFYPPCLKCLNRFAGLLFFRNQFPVQKVDAAYCIGLISFVEEDYVVAKTYLEKVIQIGNKMHFVSKAEHYLSKINDMNLEES